MVRTRVGYAGGSKMNPTYHDLGDHSEAIQVVYDPGRISYEELLRVFWESHDPGQRPWSRQYRSAVFHHGDRQKKSALETRDRIAAAPGKAVHTEILPAAGFTPAEDYHQKFYLRRRPDLLREYAAIYPDPRDLAASTAAARVNGYLGGNGTLAGLLAELGSLGLSPGGERLLAEFVRASRARAGSGTVPGSACAID